MRFAEHYDIELCLPDAFPMLADVLDEGEDTDADDDEVIVPSGRWSGRGPGEAGSMRRECRLYFLVDE